MLVPSGPHSGMRLKRIEARFVVLLVDLCSTKLLMRSQTYDIEMRVDNLQMDMTGVELSVANAHRQVQRMENEVVAPLLQKVSDMYQDFFTSSGAMESRFDGLLDEHHERLNAVELGNGIAAEKCDSVQDVLMSWMVTFEALETSVADAVARVQHMEDHLVTRSKELLEISEVAIDQAATIRLLQERVGELELGHGVLRACVINIEVRMLMVA
jgi:hypothetical protein